MHIVSYGDNFNEMSNPVFWEKFKKKKNVINLSSAGLAKRVVKVKISTDDILTLKPQFTTAADDILKYIFHIFPRK